MTSSYGQDGQDPTLLIDEFDRQFVDPSLVSKKKGHSSGTSSTSVYDLAGKIRAYTKEKTTWTALSMIYIVLQGVNLLGLFFLSFAVTTLAKRPLPSLVQLTNGEVINVAPVGNRERSRAVLQRFVVETLTNLMTWDSKPQQSVTITLNSKPFSVPITVWRASFAFDESFRSSFLQELVGLVNPLIAKAGSNFKTAITFDTLTIPKKLEDGVWEVSVVADVVVLGTGTSERLPFNKTLKIKAVDTPTYDMVRDVLEKNDLQRDIFLGRQYGLVITEMKDLI